MLRPVRRPTGILAPALALFAGTVASGSPAPGGFAPLGLFAVAQAQGPVLHEFVHDVRVDEALTMSVPGSAEPSADGERSSRCDGERVSRELRGKLEDVKALE